MEKEAVMAYFKSLSQNLSGNICTKKNNENPSE
jgi:hypothetical protein